ncbi:MAG: TonB-dependent receptor, partial [Pseudomonadota bacterium]
DFSTYFLFSTGFRPGGFTSAGTLPITPFDEERAKNFEIGFRSSFLENQVQLTGSFFFIDYDDIQVVSAAPSALALTGFETVIINADEAESYGAEITLAAQITNKLTLNASYGYNESEFSSFVDPILGDQTGNRLPNAPRHSVNVSAEYIEPVSFVRDGEAYFRADYTYRSDFISFLSPTAPVLDAYDVVDLRLGLRNEGFLVEAFVENVFDEVYALGTTTLIFGDVAALEVGPTRRFGIRGEIRF